MSGPSGGPGGPGGTGGGPGGPGGGPGGPGGPGGSGGSGPGGAPKKPPGDMNKGPPGGGGKGLTPKAQLGKGDKLKAGASKGTYIPTGASRAPTARNDAFFLYFSSCPAQTSLLYCLTARLFRSLCPCASLPLSLSPSLPPLSFTGMIPGRSGKGTAGSVIGGNGMPLGVPSSTAGGLAAPQSAEVAMAAAASQSLTPSIRNVVASATPSSGVSFNVDIDGGGKTIDEVKQKLAQDLDVDVDDLTLEAIPPPTRRRLKSAGSSISTSSSSTGTASTAGKGTDDEEEYAGVVGSDGTLVLTANAPTTLKLYIASSSPTSMWSRTSRLINDKKALTAALGITSVMSATAADMKQISADATELSYHPWHIQGQVPVSICRAHALAAVACC